MRVLVVEDEPTSLKLACLVLTSDGHAVETAQTADEAVKIIKEARPDVILVDLQLPGANGLVLARRLKLDPETRLIGIVAVTSFPNLFSRQSAFDAGCDAYIEKPIDTRRLSIQLASVVFPSSE